MNKHQVAGTEKVGGIQIWFVGEVSDAGRRDAVEVAQRAIALGGGLRGYRMYVAAEWNATACEWAKAEITRRRNHEVLLIVDQHARPARAGWRTAPVN